MVHLCPHQGRQSALLKFAQHLSVVKICGGPLMPPIYKTAPFAELVPYTRLSPQLYVYSALWHLNMELLDFGVGTSSR